MTIVEPRTARPAPTAAPPADRGQWVVRVAMVAAASLVIAVVGGVLPAWPAGTDMGSTHYMGLLTANQPWNLLLFMATPVILAETIAVTELVVLFSQGRYPWARAVNRYAGLVAGFYFLGVVSYLTVHAVVPLTRDGGWRGGADVVAVGFYLAGLVPLYGMALLETGVLGAGRDETARRKLHAVFVGIFLVVAHIAMIFGMLDPTVLGWHSTLPGGDTMPGMHMS